MNYLTMETMARRLDRVEHENRRLKRTGVAALVVIAALVLMGQATPSKVAKVVEAEKFVLRDTAGKIRGELKVNGGDTFLILNDENERSRFKALVYSEGGYLDLSGRGKARASLKSTSLGGSLILRDSAGKDRASLFILFNRPFLHLKDKSEKVLVEGSVSTNGRPGLTLRNKDGIITWRPPPSRR